jgi:hypothetical protein
VWFHGEGTGAKKFRQGVRAIHPHNIARKYAMFKQCHHSNNCVGGAIMFEFGLGFPLKSSLTYVHPAP